MLRLGMIYTAVRRILKDFCRSDGINSLLKRRNYLKPMLRAFNKKFNSSTTMQANSKDCFRAKLLQGPINTCKTLRNMLLERKIRRVFNNP